MPLAQEDERVAQKDAQPADKDEDIAPEADREQADEVVGHQEEPGIAFKEELVELRKELVEIQRQVKQDAEDETDGQVAAAADRGVPGVHLVRFPAQDGDQHKKDKQPQPDLDDDRGQISDVQHVA